MGVGVGVEAGVGVEVERVSITVRATTRERERERETFRDGELRSVREPRISKSLRVRYSHKSHERSPHAMAPPQDTRVGARAPVWPRVPKA